MSILFTFVSPRPRPRRQAYLAKLRGGGSYCNTNELLEKYSKVRPLVERKGWATRCSVVNSSHSKHGRPEAQEDSLPAVPLPCRPHVKHCSTSSVNQEHPWLHIRPLSPHSHPLFTAPSTLSCTMHCFPRFPWSMWACSAE